MKTDFDGGMFFSAFVALAAVATFLLAPAAAHAAGDSGPVGPGKAVRFEEIPGSTLKRVILTGRAAQRLGIETGEVVEETIVPKQMVGGWIIPPVENLPKPRPDGGVFGGFGVVTAAAPRPVEAPATSRAAGESWVLVTLSQGEWDRLAKDEPARVLPLATRDKLGNDVLALPSGMPPREDMKRSMLKLYYVVPGNDHGLTLGQRVRVELQLLGSREKRLVVPYDAVYYDGQGNAWVYVNPEPLVFERQPIDIERIEGDLAVLFDGPPVGTTVVTVGAALLYGAEVIFGR